MRFYSTRNPALRVSFREAVLQGLAPDGGLFMPAEIPYLSDAVVHRLPKMPLPEIAAHLLTPYLQEDFTSGDILRLIEEAFTFPAPVTPLTETLFILELFHGPTLAFKDFGAQFMASVFQRLAEQTRRTITILVATSGDTGSAVARGFWKKEGLRVVLLYPAGKVSDIQERQLTALGENVFPVKIHGTFDDCQRLVKTAFMDRALRDKLALSSANSINIARLLPQMVYYAAGFAQLPETRQPVTVIVPSGNLGNLTAGLMAARMGIPFAHFVAALNKNDVFLHYLESGEFQPRPAVPTLSNAMDVGNPSNLERIVDLYHHNHADIRRAISAYRFDDAATRQAIQHVARTFDYILDPHTAVGYLATEAHRQATESTGQWLLLSTAHPAKFNTTIAEVLGRPTPTPERLARVLQHEPNATPLSAEYADFKDFLWHLPSFRSA